LTLARCDAASSGQFYVVFGWSELLFFSVKMKPLLKNRKPVANPTATREYKPITLQGVWWLVMPETARDVEFLQCLGQDSVHRYAPEDGEGILVSDAMIPKY